MTFHEPNTTESETILSAIQGVQLGLAFWQPHTLFTARVNQTFTTTDQVREVIYGSGVGIYSKVKEGMTMLVGSAAGLRDVGVCRVRAITGTAVTIGEESEVKLENGQYLTFTDEISIWERPVRIKNSVIYMDSDISYSDQHTKPLPMPILGGNMVLWLRGASVTVNMDASESDIMRGSIASYEFEKIYGTGLTITNPNTATPTLIFTQAGQFLIACTATSDQAKTFTRYCYIFVFSNTLKPVTNFKLSNNPGDFYGGGWDFTVQCYASDVANISERTLAVLFARDFYDNEEVSMGSHAGRENILAVGWVAEENIIQNPKDGGTVELVVGGVKYWMAKIPGWPKGTVFTKKTPSDWTEIKDQTTRDGLIHFFQWRCNVTQICDVIISDDGKFNAEVSAPRGKLWDQLVSMTTPVNLTVPCVDQYGRIWIQPDANLMVVANRGDVPVVASLDKSNVLNPIEFSHQTLPTVSQLDFSGVAVDSSGQGSPYFTYANGRMPKHYGDPDMVDKMLLANQAESNILAGLIMGKRNNKFPEIPLTLTHNNHFLDVAPQMYAEINISAADNLRGVAFNGRGIPRRIERSHDPKTGVLTTRVVFEAESFPEISVIGDPEDPIESTHNPRVPVDPETPVSENIELLAIRARGIVLQTAYGVFFCAGDNVTGINSDSPFWISLNGVMSGLQDWEPYYVKDIAVDNFGTNVLIRSGAHIFLAYAEETSGGANWFFSQSDLKNLLVEEGLVGEEVGLSAFGPTFITINPYTGQYMIVAGLIPVETARTKWALTGYDIDTPLITNPVGIGPIDFGSARIGDGWICRAVGTIYASYSTNYSDDGGVSWGAATAGPGIGVALAVPIYQVGGSKIFYQTPGSNPGIEVLKSTDGGQNWTFQYKFTDATIWSFGVAPDNSCMVYITAGLDGVGVYTSSDSGVTWTRVHDGTGLDAFTTLYGFGGGVWLAAGGEDVWVSFDSGVTWETRTGNLKGISGDGTYIVSMKIEALL